MTPGAVLFVCVQENDLECPPRCSGHNQRNFIIICDSGKSADFPESPFHGKGRKGKQHSWGYYGDPGTNGVLKEKKNGGFVVITHGNPANMPMYETVKELQDRLTEIAKEVFS